MLTFLLQHTSFDWSTSIADFSSYFEETKWIKLEGDALVSFLEKILWREIFESRTFSKENAVVEFLSVAWEAQLISTKFWKDFQDYTKKDQPQEEIRKTRRGVNFAILEQTDGFSYFLARSGYKKEEPSVLPILESLVYDSIFPVAHPFEGRSSEEFSEYSSRLAVENKNEFFNFFARVTHPFFSRKYFKLLKYKDLVVLIKEKHKREGLVISVEQLEKVLKIFDVHEQVNIEIFFQAWLAYLFQSITIPKSASYLAVEAGRILEEEGILDKEKLDLDAAHASLIKLFVWKEEESIYFFEQAKGWLAVETPPAAVLVLTDDDQIYAYFEQLNVPFLKDLKGNSFLKNWIALFFDVATIGELKAFVEVFKSSFFGNSLSVPKKRELFFKRFFQLKDGFYSFERALLASPKSWLEFRQNSPSFFDQYAQKAAPKPVQMSISELLNYYLTYGVLPKEEGSLQTFAKKLMEKNGADLAKQRGFILASLSDSKKKKNLIHLLRHVSEQWFYDLLHPNLSTTLNKLVLEVRKRTGSNFFADLRLQHPVDRILFFADSLSKTGSSNKHLIVYLLPVFEQWVDTKSTSFVAELFRGSEQKAEVLVLIQHASRKVKKIVEEETEKKGVEESIASEPEEVDFGEGVSIYNAGMILCWPFFGRFFSALGLVEQGNFKGQYAEERAVQLLQYLATGMTTFEEWDLSLNKILCGVPLNTPIAPSIEITVEEEELVKKLINGTIFNWEKMRGTKLETFRETFFMREGMLYEKDNRWELFVERKAYDVLMDTLTWNISMINLSWMKKRLNVQWK
jgi:hypothetical protein